MTKRLRTILPAILAAAFASSAAAFDFGSVVNNLDRIGNIVQNADKATHETTLAEEVTIGEEMASVLAGAAPLQNNPRLQNYVNNVGLWLALQSERPDLEWHFGVLDSAAVNAFAAPGGYIFVTRGLMERLSSEAELAGVLSHEIAHVVRKHHLKAIQNNASYGIAADVAAIAIEQKGGKNSWLASNLVQGTKELYARGLDKSDEYEADRMAVVIAARGGYDPFALPQVLHELEKLDPNSADFALLFQTHPSPVSRLAAIDIAAGDRLDGYGGQPTLVQRFDSYKNGEKSTASEKPAKHRKSK